MASLLLLLTGLAPLICWSRQYHTHTCKGEKVAENMNLFMDGPYQVVEAGSSFEIVPKFSRHGVKSGVKTPRQYGLTLWTEFGKIGQKNLPFLQAIAFSCICKNFDYSLPLVVDMNYSDSMNSFSEGGIHNRGI